MKNPFSKFNIQKSSFKFNLLSTMEILVISLLVVAVSLFLSGYFVFFSSSSLWIDEIYTIEKFSSQGLVRSITDYHVPNNHIFFNALNSIIPKADPFNSIESRLISFIAIALSVGVIFRSFYKHLGLKLAVLFIGLLIASIPMMDLIFQA